jgi:hypothetical protein
MPMLRFIQEDVPTSGGARVGGRTSEPLRQVIVSYSRLPGHVRNFLMVIYLIDWQGVPGK